MYKCFPWIVVIGVCGSYLFSLNAWGEAGPERTVTDEIPLNVEPVAFNYTNEKDSEYTDSSHNILCDPDGSLIPLMEKLLALRSGSKETVSILHIGDSHVQAGFWTACLREHFHHDFGDAGRGLIVPYKMLSSNEPPNYAIKTSLPVEALRTTGEAASSPSSVEVKFNGAHCEFEIWSKTSFNSVTVLHHDRAPFLSPPDSLSIGSYCTIDNGPSHTRIELSDDVNTVIIKGTVSDGFDNPSYYGFSLENGKPGVLYHAIGYNGAAFQHYVNATTVLEKGIEALDPDLIIISLGTNNCYGRNYRSDQLATVIDNFIAKIKTAYPESAILMTTPRESGRKTRRGYEPNPNIEDAARLIAASAKELGVACWDMYNASGGTGTIEKWVRDGLSHKDRIHLTQTGYSLVGDMFYEAFVRYYNDWLGKNYGDPLECHPGCGKEDNGLSEQPGDYTDTITHDI